MLAERADLVLDVLLDVFERGFVHGPFFGLMPPCPGEPHVSLSQEQLANAIRLVEKVITIADEVYGFLDFVQLLVRFNKKRSWIIGHPDGIGWRDS
jgi:hypothetical protein